MKLFPYQQIIYNKIKDTPSFGLFMEAGTGKTVVSQHCFEHNGTNKLLIICLASKVDEWRDDCIEYFNDTKNITTLNKGKKKNTEIFTINNNDIYIISFQSALILKDTLKVHKNWTIIIDESQVIKNHTSKISKLCHKLGKQTDYKMILTGTPQNKGYIDYFSQLKFLGVFDKLKDFKEKFCIEELVRFGGGHSFLKIVDYKNTEILDEILSLCCVFFKRDRSIEELPTQKYINFNVNKIYNTFKKNRVLGDVIAQTMGVLRLRLRQICGGRLSTIRTPSEKEAWTKDFIENTDDRVVIFYNFNGECDILTEIINKMNRPLSIYSGQTKDVDEFNTKDNSVILVNYKSGGTGINWLSKAHKCIFYSPPESYLEFEQARKRLDRIGQSEIPMFYCLRTKGTIEEVIYQSIEKKEDFDNEKFIKYMEEN